MRYRKNKPLAIISAAQSIWEHINLKTIIQFVMPVLFLLAAGVIIVLAQWAILNRRGNSFAVGKPSLETYRVITHMRYEDQDSARALRSMVSESVVGVTVRDVSAKSRLQRRLEAIGDMNNPASKSYLSYLPDALLKAISRLSDTDKARMLNLALQIGSSYIDRLEAEKVYRGNTSLMSSILWEEINKANASTGDANFIYQILTGLGNLNFRTDEELTQLAKNAAARDVPPIDRRREPGDVIVSRGDIITEQAAMLLRLQGYTEDVFPILQFCVAVICVMVLPLWLNILMRGAGDRKPSWWCIAVIILTAWICETAAALLGIEGAGTLAAVTMAYLCIPDYLAFCIALIACSTGVSIVAGQAISNLILLATMALVSVTAGFYMLRNLESRRQVSRRTFMVTMILTCVRMSLRWLQGPPLVRDNFRLFIPLGSFWRQAAMFFIVEAFLTHIMIIILPYIEEYIDTLSILSLREVSHPSSPLLRDLQRQAPGTYQHCLTIATLIEAVGMELGMDVNLLRAGAYYHDIGKLRRPQFFVENQGGGTNAHDEMSPMLSSITIISHVKDGLELAWEARLPKRIRDFIAEHHGTTCTFYFYRKALAEGENVDKADFQYPGPAPQSRETALLMITDSVEAAVRAANIREVAAEDPYKGHATIERIVNQVVASKIAENQFDDVNFTQKDLAVIKRTLISVLTSMYHTRKVKKIEQKK